jgi:hypothetical protein
MPISRRANERVTALERELRDYKQQVLGVLSDAERKHLTEIEALREQHKAAGEATMAMMAKQSQELNSLRVI